MNKIIILIVFIFYPLFSLGRTDFQKMADSMAKKFDVPLISVDELDKIRTHKTTIIFDSRELSEFNISHIPGAIHIGFEGFSLQEVKKLVQKDSKVIIYCSVGYRSGSIGEKLLKEKFKVRNLYGGIFNWSHKNKDLVNKDNKKTKLVHGFNREWSKWLKKENIAY